MANLKIGRMVLGAVQTNCYFIYREEDRKREAVTEVICVDPVERGDYIYETLEKNGFRVAGILLTHGHFDHIMGANQLRALSGVKIYACENEKEVCENPETNLSAKMRCACSVAADEYKKDGAEITIGGMTCRLIATPGHTPGGCCYYFEEDKILISGDTLFLESVGRTDVPGGDMGDLMRSIKEKLFVLPGDVKVYPGHGESTDIAYEKANNPFCRQG